LYYNEPYDAIGSLEGFNYNNTSKILFLSASIISAPFNDIGEGFKAGSIILSGSGFILKDDKKNNLYDSSFNSSSFVNNAELNGYWGFENLYPSTLKGKGKIVSKTYEYISNTHGENLDFIAHNVYVEEGVPINNVKSGARVVFKDNTGYIFSKHDKHFNYEREENFCISFWLNAPLSQSNVNHSTNTLICKRTYADFSSIGPVNMLTDEGNSIKRNIVTSETLLRPIDIFPYHFEIYNQSTSNSGKIMFTRSDGLYTTVITSSVIVNDSLDHHICTVKSGSLLSLYIDGVLQGTSEDVVEQPTNDYHLIFGAWDFNGTKQFSGSLDEIRFYNTYASAVQVSSSLAEKTKGLLYQTANVGNVFYRRGEVVVTSPIKKYNEALKNYSWTLSYKNNYTIYEFETLVRIKAGTYNKTMNPTSLASQKTNLYLEDFTSGSLRPYVTSVGLYNEKLQLVAVGKLGRPLKMRDDVDINLIIRWDY